MKKTIIILILVIYVASIAVVNFFGLEIKTFDSETYIETIEMRKIINMGKNGEIIEAGGRYYIDNPLAIEEKDKRKECLEYYFEFIPPEEGETYTKENISTNRNMIQLDYLVLSDKGDIMSLADTEEIIDFVYDEGSGVAVYDEELRALVFLKSELYFTLRIKSLDGKGAWTEVSIMALDPSLAEE